MDEVRYFNTPMTLNEAESYIQGGLITAARAYVANGYYLRRIRDDKLFEEAGYQNFEEYVRGKYNKDKGWASKCIKVNSQLSEDGDSPILSKQYLEYTTYQLVELAYMTDDQREEVSPDMTVNQLKQIRKPEEIAEPEKSCDVTTSEQEEKEHSSEEIQDSEEVRKKEWLIRCEILKEMCDALCDIHSYGLEKDRYSMTAIQRISSGPDYSFGFSDDGYGHSKYEANYKNSQYHVKEFNGDSKWIFEPGEIDQYIWNHNGRKWHEAHPEEQKQESSPQPEPEFYNPDNEKKVNKSYSMAGLPKASNRHVTMLAQLFVRENVRRLFENGEFIGITDDDIINLLKLFQRRSNVDGIIIDDDVKVSVAERVIEFYRGDEDLGICLFQKFANYAHDQIREYISQMVAKEREEQGLTEPGSEEPESVPDQPETVLESSETVIDGEFVEVPPEQELSTRSILEEQKKELQDWLKAFETDEMEAWPLFIERQKIIIAALEAMVEEREQLESEPEQEQPELPILKNNDQRKEFIENYTTWPLWIETKETGERYYRYNLSDKIAMVVKVSWRHSWIDYKTSDGYEYSAEQYYLLGVGTEWKAGKNVYVEDETRTFYECNSNMSAMVEYLKEFQKKGKGET